jgi:thiol-disulfide isomerase/thioredoxin
MKKEIYASINFRKSGAKSYKPLSKDYYNYRNSINFNSAALGNYFPYYRFLNQYFDNVVQESSKTTLYYNKNTFRHSYKKLKLIDSLVKNETLKNSLSKSLLFKYLINCSKKDKQKELVSLFTAINNNSEHHKLIKEYSSTCKKLSKGNKIPNLMVVSTENTVKDLHSIINHPTILYFWSSNSLKHCKEIHNKAQKLKKEFPNYTFLAINMDSQFTPWKNNVSKFNYNEFEEYQFKNKGEAEKKLLIHSINKAIIVNEDAEIVNGNTNLFHINIERLLLRAFRKH